MKINFLQVGFWTLVLSMSTALANAQSLARTGYFMENATHRHLMNPALAPVRGYISLPVVGAFSMGVESNMSFTDFIYPATVQGGKLLSFLHPDVSATDFLSRMDPNNYFRMDLRTSILSLGFYTGKFFWTFDVANRLNMSLNLPYDLFAFTKMGMANSAGNVYHLDKLSMGMGMYSEVSLGFSRNLTDDLRMGVKLKYLAGVANLRANLKKMDIEMKPEVWDITTQGQIDIYGKGVSFEKDAEGVINGIGFDSPGLGGMGAAFDLGFVYSPVRNLDLSLGVVDLGGIQWKKTNIKRAEASGNASFSGLQNITADSTNSGKIEDQLQELKDDLLKMGDFREKSAVGDYIQKLFPTINAGAEYSILRNKVSAGLLYSMRLMENENYTELTGSLNLKPVSWFNLSGSYSCLHGKKETFGFALGFVPGLVNVFVACDYTILKVSPQYIPLNTMTTNFQLGVSIPLGRGYEAE